MKCLRKHVVIAGVIVALLGIGALLLARNWAEVRGWLGQIWTLIAAVPPAYVLLACGLKGLEVALNTSAWVTVLHSAYPERSVTFRQALSVVQGSIGIATVIPSKVSGVPILGLYRAAFPDLGIAGLIATRTVQGLTASVLAIAVLLAFGVSSIDGGNASGLIDRITAFSREQPLLAIAATVLGCWLVILVVRRGRAGLGDFGQQLVQSGAILRTPARYALLVVAPTALAFACRWGVTGVLLAAFEFPVTLETLIRVNISHGLARSIQVAPGGLGTTQAFDLVALQGLAPVEVITAYSLAQSAILLAFNVTFALAALAWAYGWERTRALFPPLRRVRST